MATAVDIYVFLMQIIQKFSSFFRIGPVIRPQHPSRAAEYHVIVLGTSVGTSFSIS